MPYEIFISYRRDDAAVEAAWLYSVLNTFFGEEATFFDKHEIASGDRWTEVLQNRVEQARVVLVLIGSGWLKAQDKASYRRRLDMDQDWVRKEIAHALTSVSAIPEKKIIPVLLDGTAVPGAQAALPPDIAPVAEWQLAQFKTDQYLGFAEYLYNQLAKVLPPVMNFDDAQVASPYDLLDYPLPPDLPRPPHPYTGLDYFKREQARIFFGRSSALLELIKKLEGRSTRIVRLYGQSGVGKSSLLHAGLYPRLEKSLNIRPHRRDKSIGLAAGLLKEVEAVREHADEKRPPLFILDQAEEMFTNPNTDLPNEKSDFIAALQQVHTEWPTARFILGYRVERDSDFRKMLDEAGLDSNEFYLQRLETRDIVDAIRGVTRDSELNEKYNLAIEEGLPQKIAGELGGDEQSQIAPMLQLLLRKMWDAVEKNAPPRVFTNALYNRFKQDSIQGMLMTQLGELEKINADAVKTGLALDILHFFTTEAGTSGAHTDEELLSVYPLYNGILELKEDLKRLYLLTDASGEHATRLVHDALAQVVIRQYNLSEAPAQKATKFLQNTLFTKSSLDKAEYVAVQEGFKYRRKLSEAEKVLVDEGLRQHYKVVARDLISNNKLEESFQQIEAFLNNNTNEETVERSNKLSSIRLQYARYRQDYNAGGLTYDDSIILRNQIKQTILTFIDSIEAQEKSVVIEVALQTISSGDLNSSLKMILDFSERTGNQEWLSFIQTAYSQYLDVQTDFEKNLATLEDYTRYSSRTAFAFLQFVEQSLNDQEAAVFLQYFQKHLTGYAAQSKDAEVSEVFNKTLSLLEIENDLDMPVFYLRLFLLSLISGMEASGEIDPAFRIMKHIHLVAYWRNDVNDILSATQPTTPATGEALPAMGVLVEIGKNNIARALAALNGYMVSDTNLTRLEMLKSLGDKLKIHTHEYETLQINYDSFSFIRNENIYNLIKIYRELFPHNQPASVEFLSNPNWSKEKIMDLISGNEIEQILAALSIEKVIQEDLDENYLDVILSLHWRFNDAITRYKEGGLPFPDFNRLAANIREAMVKLFSGSYPTKSETNIENPVAIHPQSRLPVSGVLQPIDSIIELLREAREREAILYLLLFADSKTLDAGVFNKLYQVNAMLNYYEHQSTLGLIPFSVLDSEQTEIRKSLLELCNELEPR